MAGEDGVRPICVHSCCSQASAHAHKLHSPTNNSTCVKRRSQSKKNRDVRSQVQLTKIFDFDDLEIRKPPLGTDPQTAKLQKV
eukprot:4921279-Amphidinium_carterae.1